MISVLMIRHGRTDWNLLGKIQGQTDVGLSVAGISEVAARSLPEELLECLWCSSPLKRAVQTARLLSGKTPRTDARLREMNWGEWEGLRLAELRRSHGEQMAENEARGLDFRPPGGESPREVGDRLLDWLLDIAREKQPVVAVTHKGVIRAGLSLATGWDMTAKPPVKLQRSAAHVFSFEASSARLRLRRANIHFQGDESDALAQLHTG